ncbi:MAG: DNA-binding protein [Candidatus Thiodiazotropha sp.]
MKNYVKLRTPDEIRAEFSALGLSIASWARAHHFSVPLVYRVLANPDACCRGQSHRIAVRLGLKPGRLGTLEDLSFEKMKSAYRNDAT